MEQETQSVVGIHVEDPRLPGRLYLTPDYYLTKEKSKAKIFDQRELHRGLKQIKKFGGLSFVADIFQLPLVQ